MQYELVEAGFEYVCDRNYKQVFRERNYFLQKTPVRVMEFVCSGRGGI